METTGPKMKVNLIKRFDEYVEEIDDDGKKKNVRHSRLETVAKPV